MSIIDYYYDANFSSSTLAWTTFWVAQTFTPATNYDIKAVRLRMLKDGTPGTITVSIRATSAGKPVTPDLVSATVDGTTIGTSYEWVTFTFSSPISLSSGTQYAIVVSNSTGTSGANYVRLAMDSAASSYTGGIKLHNSASGVNGSWLNVSGSDIIFLTSDDGLFTPLQAAIDSPADATGITILTTMLSWNTSFHADSYDVWFGLAGDMAQMASGQTDLNYSLIGQLLAATDYEWRIDSVNADGTTEGSVWTFHTFASSTLVRNIDFIYSSTIAYVAEFGDQYIRFWYNDAVITSIVSPYLTEHLFQLHVHQIGDTMWIVHEGYAPRKLTRTSASTFSLDVIPYDEGPFLERNDIVNPDTIGLAKMSYSSGNLVCTGDIFEAGHVGAIFKLIHPKPDAVVSLAGDGTSNSTEGYGSIQFITRGIWTGEIRIERNENGAGWDTFRTWKGSKEAEQNVNLTFTEDSYKTRFRIATTGASKSFRGDLEIKERLQEGIVKITAVSDSQNATAYPIASVASSSTTRRWAEGAWSTVRTYPRSIGFFEGRCVLMGERVIQKPVLGTIVPPE